MAQRAQVQQTHVISELKEAELTDRLRAASRRLDAVIDRMRGAGTALDPALLRQVVEVINGGVLEAAEDYQRMLEEQWRQEGFGSACSTACWASDLRCPTSEPFAPMAEQLRAAGFETYLDPVEEQVAASTRCICGEAMGYVALQRGRDIKAWAVCPSCGHWLPL